VSSGMPKEPYITHKRALCKPQKDLLTLLPRPASMRLSSRTIAAPKLPGTPSFLIDSCLQFQLQIRCIAMVRGGTL